MMSDRLEQGRQGLTVGRAVVAASGPAWTGLEARIMALEMAHAALAGELRQQLRQQGERVRGLEAAVIRLEERPPSRSTEQTDTPEDDSGTTRPRNSER